MKMNRLIRMMAMGVLVMGICSCSKDIPGAEIADNEQGEPMALIIDGNGTPVEQSQDQSNATQNRATEVGFATKFENGDKVGVLVSKSGGTFENIEFTYDTQKWNPATPLKYYAGATYTVYYPYNSLITNQATYDQYITNFNPAIDQGTAALYTANDPMSGVGAIGGNAPVRTLTVRLKHLMGLYIIYPPQQDVLVTFNGGRIPHLIEGSHRYHVKPGSQISITGSCMIDGKNNSFAIPQMTIAANKYKIFRLKYNSGSLPETRTINVNGANFEFILVKKGVFQMGSPIDEAERSTNENQHWVKLSKDYYIAKTEVTSAQWYAIQRGTGNFGNTTPEESVSNWDNISNTDGYLEKINSAHKGNDGKFVLPTEAQWEYAARGGHKAEGYMQYPGTHTDLSSVAYYNNDSQVQPVAGKKANQLGLYDMAGNIGEICRDWYTDTYAGGTTQETAVVDPFIDRNPGTNVHVMRGGGYSSVAKKCRSAARSTHSPTSLSFATGFRLVFEPNI